jgi:crotonobetainyl-CoA:carnitine CoA-transferase CaiB-like acyl-CoA transferase
MVKPLEGIKILEWAIWLAGPGATMMLGDPGAEVIKIEQPVVGE